MDNALALYKKGRYEAATTAFRKVLACDELNPAVLFYLARSLYRTGRFSQALRYWKKCGRIAPSQQYVHLNSGCAYEKLGQTVSAIRNYKRELEINPLCVEALYNLGNLYYERHKYKQAARFLEQCYSLRHSINEIAERLAYSYFKTRQRDNEIRLYQDRLQANPNDTWCLKNLAVALIEAGEHNRATLYLRKAERLNPEDRFTKRNIQRAELARKRLRPQASSLDHKGSEPIVNGSVPDFGN